jgi:predicted aspartyl protease
VIHEALAKELGIVARSGDEAVLANGSVDKVGVGSAEVEIQGITRIVPIYLYKETLVDLTTLEAAGLRANPVAETLEQVRGKLL